MRLLGKIKSLLIEYAVQPKSNLGQNFCLDGELLQRMVAYSRLSNRDTVLEIGGGFGFLTQLLSRVAKQVVTVELDPKLLKALQDSFKDKENIVILHGNILEIELPSFNKIVSNPPYSIASALTMLLFRRRFDCAVLTLQKEFVDKMIAKVGTREYGPLSVIINYKAHVKILEYVPQESFFPQPKVESVVVSIQFHKPAFILIDEELFYKLVSYLFTQRNRNVRRPLESFLLKEMAISKVEARLIIDTFPKVSRRVRNLNSEDFGELSNKFSTLWKSKKITLKNNNFYIFPDVYPPSEDTFVIAEHLDVQDGEMVLDMGTGCGILAIFAAEKAGKVVAIDINPEAVKCAKFNVKLNSFAKKVETIASDLFSGLNADAKFDLIIFNPPYLPVTQKIRTGEWLERAWFGGSNGREVTDMFLKTVNKHVTEDGRVIMTQSSLSNPEESIERLRKMGFEVEIRTEKRLFFERLVVIRAKK